MEKEQEDDEKDYEPIVPITEWPVADQQTSATNDNSEKETNVLSTTNKRPSASYNGGCNDEDLLPVKQLKTRVEEQIVMDCCKEPLVFARVAKWWRRNKSVVQNLPVDAISTNNPNTKLFFVSRTAACKEFLKEQYDELKAKSRNLIGQNLASVYTAMASIQDWLQDYTSALTSITLALSINPDYCEYKWLQEKLQRQCAVLHRQREIKNLNRSIQREFPGFKEVERISAKDLSMDDFKKRFVQKGVPVIILDVIDRMTNNTTWNLEFVKRIAGQCQANVKRSVSQSVEWASLEESRQVTVAHFVEEVQSHQTQDYLFDWSLPLHCPELAKRLAPPTYFADNFLQRTSPGSLYHDSWPSLFVAPKGVISNLHIDAFASHFWMALFQGKKRWTFFLPQDTPCLYPRYFHSMDPVFEVDIRQPDLDRFPMLGFTHPTQCVLEAGELLFVPGGSAHFVENLTDSVAVSSNFVDGSNYLKVVKEMEINALLDPRAADLLKQLKCDKFAKCAVD